MKLKTKITLVAVPIIIGAGTYFAINTRPGVHLMLDVLSEIGSPAEVQTSAAEGPLVLTANISPIEKIQLPTEIEQPSGIKHRNGAVSPAPGWRRGRTAAAAHRPPRLRRLRWSGASS